MQTIIINNININKDQIAKKKKKIFNIFLYEVYKTIKF